MDVALEVDCRGQACPTPVITLARRLGEVAVGEIVGLVADDAAAGVDVPAWCRMKEQEYLGDDRSVDGLPRYLVRRLS